MRPTLCCFRLREFVSKRSLTKRRNHRKERGQPLAANDMDRDAPPQGAKKKKKKKETRLVHTVSVTSMGKEQVQTTICRLRC